MKTILFVENDPVVLTMYRNRLQAAGFTIETAEDGLEALKCLSRVTPDLAMLDLMLPRLSGADVLKIIRNEPRLKQIPVILFSLHLSGDVISRFKSGSIRGAVAKSEAARDLLDAVRSVLNGGTFFPEKSAAVSN